MKVSSRTSLTKIASSLALAVLGLCLTSAICRAAGRSNAATVMDQLKAAQADAAATLEQDPPPVPADWSHAKEINEAGGSTVACGRCGGSGSLTYGKCRGTGRIACPECRGKPIRCPLRKGKKELGK